MIKRLRIRDLREDGDITQKELAVYLGCDQSDYSKIERGNRALPLWMAYMLADYYKTSIDYLVGRTEVKEPYARK